MASANRSVQDGVIKRLSPSMINAFDSTTGFGCERRWWLKYVAGEKEPETPNLRLGTELHAIIEAYLRQTEERAEGEAAGLFLHGVSMVDEVRQRGIVALEAPVETDVLGIPLIGYSDVVTQSGIVDWKTTSDFKRYGKTPEDLAMDSQLLVYGMHFHGNLPSVSLAHGYFQTKGRLTKLVEVTLTKDQLWDNHAKKLHPLVTKMIDAAKAPSHTELEPQWEKCFRCPFRAKCPKEPNAVANFFNRLHQAQSVVPPDAPKSDPALAAKPVEGFSPVPAPKERKLVVPTKVEDAKPTEIQVLGTMLGIPLLPDAKPTAPEIAVVESAPAPAPTPPVNEAPKKRGRPPGSKNAPKTQPGETVSPGGIIIPEVAQKPKADIVFRSVTLTHGLTINLGNYNSARIEVGMTADVNGATLEEATQKLREAVIAQLDIEAKPYEGMKEGAK